MVEGNEYADALLNAKQFCKNNPQAYVVQRYYALAVSIHFCRSPSVLVPSYGNDSQIRALPKLTLLLLLRSPYAMGRPRNNDTRSSSATSK